MCVSRLSVLFLFFTLEKGINSNRQLKLGVLVFFIQLCFLFFHTKAQSDERSTLWLDELEKKTWVTVANLKQDSRDVSASVTVFTREDIERRQFHSLYDLLRSIPGMTVARKSAPTSTVDHASNTKYFGRGLEIEVNGVPQNMAVHSITVIELLPPIETIDRIEVVRGSNSAADNGSRSFKGSIKITTRSAEYNDEPSIYLRANTRDQYSTYAYYNNRNETHHLSFSAHLSQEYGFDKNIPKGTQTPPQKSIVDDDASIQHYMLQYAIGPSSTSELRIDTSYTKAGFEIPGRMFPLDTVIPELSSQGIIPEAASPTMDYSWMAINFFQRVNANNETNLRLSHQDWRWRLNWPICAPKVFLSEEAKTIAKNNIDQFEALFTGGLKDVTSNPDLMRLIAKLGEPGQTDTVCGHWPLSSDISRTIARIQHTATVTPEIKWLYGISGNHYTINSEPPDKSTYNTIRTYTHLQWDIKNITLNTGISNEHFSGRDALSSRVGFNYHIDNTKTLRLAIAKSKKIPDIADLENNFGQLYVITSEEVAGSRRHIFYEGNDLNKNIDPQTVYNQEFGLAWRPSRRETIDIRFFKDRYTNISFYDIYLISLSDSANIDKQGVELQYNRANSIFSYGLAAHFHDSTSSNLIEDYQSMGGSAYFTRYFRQHYNLSLNLYFNKYKVNNVDLNQWRYNRQSTIFDLQLGRKLINNVHVSMYYQFDNSHFLSNLYLPNYYEVNYDDKHTIGINIKLDF